MFESVTGLLRQVASELADGGSTGSETRSEGSMADAASYSLAMVVGGLLDAAPDGMLVTDSDGVIRVANAQAERMLGYDPGELVGLPIETLVPVERRGAHVAHRQGYEGHPQTRRMGMGLELVALRKDGTVVPTEISLRPLQTPEGRFVVSAIRDVTERREAEELLRQQADALARSNEALQQFAYVASHDLQEPLRMVSSYLQLLERRYHDRLDQDAHEFIGYAVDGARRMSSLIQDLLAYARVGRSDVAHVKVDLGDVVDKVLRDLEVVVKETGATVRVSVLPVITGDAGQLYQLYQNLVGNALKFRKPGAAPVLEIGAKRTAAGWELWVKDDGIGFDSAYADRIFQIFQRLHTRADYPGTGIGLAICKRIVEHHGGAMRAESSPGDGATFFFTIPDRRRTWAT